MKELNFDIHNNGYYLIKGFGMIHNSDATIEPVWMHAQIISDEQSPDAIANRMSRISQDAKQGE